MNKQFEEVVDIGLEVDFLYAAVSTAVNALTQRAF